MKPLLNILTVIIALFHVYILILEIFLWDKPRGLKVFNQTLDKAITSKGLAANQSLYNGFLAAGLFLSLFLGSAGMSIKVYVLVCILIAGLYGCVTVSHRVIFIQTVPAAVALILIWVSQNPFQIG